VSKGLEYYAYLSEHTIQRLFEQIPKRALSSIAVELGIDIKILTAKLTMNKNDSERTLTSQVRAVVKYLEKEEPQNIGTVDNPKKYVKGTLQMFSYFLPQGFGVKEDATPELIYYGGSTEETILGLAGAASYVYASTDGSMSHISSSLPHLVSVIAKEYKITSSHPRFRQRQVSISQVLDTIEYMEEYNREDAHLQSFSFFAKLKLDSKNVATWNADKRVLLASPLYIAYAD
jgi:hypothetical protein